MLDNSSPVSFIQESLVRKMQTSGRKTTLNLKTLNGERCEPIIAIYRLQVAGGKDGNTWIKLSRVYTTKHVLVDKEEVATPKKMKNDTT